MRKGTGSRLAGPLPWVIGFWASFLLVPWYGLESGLSASTLPAVGEALWHGRAWLLVLLPPLLMASLAGSRRWPRLMAAAGLSGLLLLALEAFLIAGKSQPPLGWGALVYASAALVVASYGLAWQGWCRGDVFIVAAIGAVCGSTLVFVG